MVNGIHNAFYILGVCFILICTAKSDLHDKYRIVETNNGKVLGVLNTTLIKKHEYYAYKGIPYAKSPIGELRFKAPEPSDSWAPEVFNATKHGPACFQPPKTGYFVSPTLQSEDCLFLNVYVPADIKPNEKLAVMVHIHCGGFGTGTGDDNFTLGPDFLLEQRVIVATMNYRLGVFGFISLNTTEHSGNMGLKDQQLALKWFHSNIEYFSGDNQRITIFGLSAGGPSTHLHMLSSESRKYFRNAIPISGVADNYWGLNEKSDNLDYAHQIAAELDKPKKSTEELIEFFKSVPAEKLVPYGDVMGFMERTCNPVLKPVMERKDAIRPFVIDEPDKIYNQSDININAMFAHSQYEYITFYSFLAKETSDLKGLDSNFTLKLPFRNVDIDSNSEFYKHIVKKIRKLYFKDAPIDENMLKQYINLLSDVNFAYGTQKAAKRHADNPNVKSYFIRFAVDSALSVLKTAMGGGNVTFKGAGHADDLCYLFRCEVLIGIYDKVLQNPNDTESQITLKTIEYMTKIYSNFAKYDEPVYNGDPIPDFLPIQKDYVHFLDVTNDGLKTGVNPDKKRMDLWAEVEHIVKNHREEL